MSEDWKTAGRCANMPLNEMDALFFPSDNERPGRARWERERQAKKVCVGCPVATKCLAYALRTNQVGVWGETTDDDRKKIKRVGHRVTCAKCRSTDIFTDEHGTVEICIRCGVSWLVRTLARV